MKGRSPGRNDQFGYVVCAELRLGVRDVSWLMETWDGAESYLNTVVKLVTPIAWVARAEDPNRAEILRGEQVAADKRVYVVEVNQQNGDAGKGVPDTMSFRLIEAAQPAQAIRHVAKGMISARVAKQKDLVELVGKGIKVEQAGDDA